MFLGLAFFDAWKQEKHVPTKQIQTVFLNGDLRMVEATKIKLNF